MRTQHDDARELKLLNFVFDQPNLDEIQGHPQKVLDLIDEFSRQIFLMNVGAEKGKFITDLIDETKPQTMIELGSYVGYSAVLFGDAVRRNGGKRYLSLELNPLYAAISKMMVELAGLRDFVTIIVGRSDVSLHKLFTKGEVKHIELMFIDHYKPLYTTDLKLCEQLGMVSAGSILVADNVIYPGNPVYLEYVRSTVEQKREAAKKTDIVEDNFMKGGRTSLIFLGKDDKPAFSSIGNPNLVYDTEFVQPEGYTVSFNHPLLDVYSCTADWFDRTLWKSPGALERRRLKERAIAVSVSTSWYRFI